LALSLATVSSAGHSGQADAVVIVPLPAADEFSAEALSVIDSARDRAGVISTTTAIRACSDRVVAATDRAVGDAELDRGRETLDEAAAMIRHHPGVARQLVDRVLEVSQPADLANRAWWIRATTEETLGHYEDALEAWGHVAADEVWDYLEVRRIEVLLALGESVEAAQRAVDLVEALEGTSASTIHGARELRIRALAAAGNREELIDEGAEFLEIYSEYPRRDQVWTWLAEAHLAVGEVSRAARYYDRIVWRYPYRPNAYPAWLALESMASTGVSTPRHSFNDRFERARNLRVNKHWEIVDNLLADLVDDVVAAGGDTSFANEIRYERARNSYGRGDYDAAVAQLEEIQDNGGAGVRAWRLRTLLSDSHARAGRLEDGVEAIRRRDQGRSTTHRHQELAEYYWEVGRFPESLEHYREVRSASRMDDWDMSLLMFTAEEYEQAAINFEALAEGTHGRSRRRYRYWQARALQELGRIDEAREWFREIHEVWPSTYYGLQAENRLIELEWATPELVARRDEAEPSAPGANEESLQVLAEGLVWELSVGLTEIVVREVPELIPEVPDSDGPWLVRPARIFWDGPSGVGDAFLAHLAADEEIESAYFSAPDPQALDSLADTYGDLFPTLRRASFLHSVGERTAAWDEARSAVLEFRGLDYGFSRRRPSTSRPIELSRLRHANYIDHREVETGYWGISLGDRRFPTPTDRVDREAHIERQLAIYDVRHDVRDAFRDGLMVLGDYHLVRRLARDRGGWSSTEPDGERRQDWSEAYPRAYPELVQEFAEDFENNPYVIWALMTVESSYNPDSISRANARGLLQVIPKTGNLISQRLGYWDFGPDNLMMPALSIEFGNYYFSELMTKFHGQELIAFSAYNAGPHNMESWLDGRGSLPLDAFIETIPFDQAREYSKKVFRYLALYRRIYLGEDSLYVGQDLDPTYEDNIHF
jgi:tetratricopeptide (TPR) repeat protein